MFTLRQFPNTRLRRTRNTKFIRNLVAENYVTVNDLVYPVFLLEGKKRREPAASMLGLERLSTDELLKDIEIWCALGINAIALFPVVPTEKKSTDGHYAWQEEGCIQQAIKKIKHHFPQLGIIADVALDPYTLHGQDGIIDNNGVVLNDETVSLLVKQALSLAYAGADVIAPSDMMDGRIKKIRDTLEEHELTKTLILSYSAKYASNYYGPFREAIGSKKEK